MTDIAGLIEQASRLLDINAIGSSDTEKLVWDMRDALARLAAELAECDKLAIHHSDRADTAEATLTAPVGRLEDDEPTENPALDKAIEETKEAIRAAFHPKPAPIEGLTLETTEEERAQWMKMVNAGHWIADTKSIRLLRDHATLTAHMRALANTVEQEKAEVARLTAQLDEAYKREIEDAITIGRLNSGEELQAVMRMHNETIGRLAAETAAREDAKASLENMTDERDAERAAREAAETRVDKLEMLGEEVAAEFEGDCWKAMRRLLTELEFDWDGDPVTADAAENYIRECFRDAEAALARAAEALRIGLEDNDDAAVNAIHKALSLLSRPTSSTGEPE